MSHPKCKGCGERASVINKDTGTHPLPGCYEAYIVKLIQDRDFWARTAKAYKDDYKEVIREGPSKKIEKLENQLTASLMRNRELETSGTIAMDKVEKLEGRVVRVFERNEALRTQVMELKKEKDDE